MTGQLAAREPYTTRFETEVAAVDGHDVWLETSYFFGASGGQPADRGRIGDAEVADVRLVDGERVHVLDAEPSLRPGQRVLCSIDWEFRMYCMRAHTAAHVLLGAANRLLADPGDAGLEIADGRVAIALETDEIDDETLIELDERVNRVVWESRPVSWEDVPIADARERDDVAFDDERADPAVENGRVRLVTVGPAGDDGRRGLDPIGDGGEPWNVAPCGGTHVRNTREVGPVTVLGRSRSDGVTRIEFAVGRKAIERRTAEKRAAIASTQALEVDVDSVPDELGRPDA